MCGISGLISRNPINDKQANHLLELFCDMETEGSDAAGFYNGKRIVKFPTTPSSVIALRYNHMIDLDLYEEILNTKIVLNHNRAATQGHQIENKNNHPFESKNFIFSHNGVLTGDFFLKSFNAEEEPETDSWLFLRRLEEKYEEKNDLISSLKIAIGNVSGTLTFWLYDKNTNDVYFYNDNRRLYYYRDRGEFWFASLESYLKRNLNAKPSSIFSFPVNRLYKFSIADFQLRNICSILHNHSTVVYSDSYWRKKYTNKKKTSNTSNEPNHKSNQTVSLTPDLRTIMDWHRLEISYVSDESVYIKFQPGYEETLRDLHWNFKGIHDCTVSKNVLILPKSNWDIALLDIINSLSEEC